jgi:hypothetical protein
MSLLYTSFPLRFFNKNLITYQKKEKKNTPGSSLDPAICETMVKYIHNAQQLLTNKIQ